VAFCAAKKGATRGRAALQTDGRTVRRTSKASVETVARNDETRMSFPIYPIPLGGENDRGLLSVPDGIPVSVNLLPIFSAVFS